MTFICFWHVIVHGYGFSLYGEPGFSTKGDLRIIIFFCTLFSPATYCFMFISGWFGIKFSLRKFFYFAFTGIICSICTITFRFFVGDIDYWFPIITRLFPIACQKWWFLTGYIMVFLISPFIEAGLISIEKNTLKHIIYIMTFIEVASFIILRDYIGRSFYGLLYIYILARYLRKINFNCSVKALIITYIFSFTTLWTISYFAVFLGKFKWVSWILLGSYNNPAIIIMSVTIFLFINKLRTTHNKWLNWAFENVLVIYLLTEGIGLFLYKYEANLIDYSFIMGILFVFMTIIISLVIGKIISQLFKTCIRKITLT